MQALISLEHIDPKRGVLVCGFENELNEVVADSSYNSRKVNRFVPYRVCQYSAPTNFGDLGEFLIRGEWVICEFGGPNWWAESNDIGNAHVSGGKSLRYTLGCQKTAEKLSVPVTCVDTGATYKSLREAERQTMVKSGSISRCCKGKGETAGGFRWKYA